MQGRIKIAYGRDVDTVLYRNAAVILDGASPAICRRDSLKKIVCKMALLFLFSSLLILPLIEARAKDEDKAGKLIQRLNSTHAHTRAEAAKELGRIRDTNAVPPLINALGDSNSYVRGQAARALGKIKDPRAVLPLIKALGDNFIYVRQEAAEALGDIKDAGAAVPLAIFLKDDDTYAREEAAKSLIKIGLPAISSLINAPKENNFRLVADVYYFFVCMGESGSEDAIVKALNEYGSRKMALDLRNCGNARLEAASRKWIESHKIKIKKAFGGENGPVWGRCRD